MANLYAYIDGNYVEAEYLNTIPYEPEQHPQVVEPAEDMYYEAGYIESGYYETLDPGDFIVDGYFEPGYIDSFVYGSAETLTYVSVYALLEKQPGIIKEFESTFISEFLQYAEVGKVSEFYSEQACEFAQESIGNVTLGAVAELTVETTVTATLSNIYGADLFAFSEAQLSAQVDRIRDINLDASGVFDVAVDYVRYRDDSADAAALFDAFIQGLRSRDTSMETQAAFSFNADVDRIRSTGLDVNSSSEVAVDYVRYRDVSQDIISESTVDSNGIRVRYVDSDIQSEFTVVAEGGFSNEVYATLVSEFKVGHINDGGFVPNIKPNAIFDNESIQNAEATVNIVYERVRFADSQQTANSQVFVVLSNIYGADIRVDGFASLSAQANSIQSARSNQSDNFAVSAIPYRTTRSNSQLRSYFSTFSSRLLGGNRPKNFVSGVTSGAFTTVSKFGTHSFRGTNAYYSPTNTPPKANQDWVVEYYLYSTAASQIGFTSVNVGTQWFTISISRSSNDFRKFLTVFTRNSDDTVYYVANNVELFTVGQNSWYHLALVKTNNIVSFYINGQRIATASAPLSYNQIETKFITVQCGNLFYIDEVSCRYNDTYGFNAESTTIQVPTAARTNDLNTTQFLYHFDNNGLDDVSLGTQQINAAISSTSSIQAVLTGPVRSSANLTSNVTISCSAGKLGEINLVAFDDAELTAVGTRVKFADATLTNEVQQTATARKIVDALSNISGAFADSVLIAKISGVGINMTANFTVSADTSITASALMDAAVSIEINTLASRIVTQIVNIDNTATLAAQPTAVKQGAVSITAAMDFAVSFSIVHIEEYVYVIPREIRQWTIQREISEWTISQENRDYIIRR